MLEENFMFKKIKNASKTSQTIFFALGVSPKNVFCIMFFTVDTKSIKKKIFYGLRRDL
jgi:hypothetical protein